MTGFYMKRNTAYQYLKEKYQLTFVKYFFDGIPYFLSVSVQSFRYQLVREKLRI